MSQSLPHDGHKRNRKQVAPKIKRYMYIRVYIAAPGLTQLPRWQRVTQSAQFMQHASFCACRFPFVLGVKRFSVYFFATICTLLFILLPL